MGKLLLIVIAVALISGDCNSQSGWFQQKSNFDNTLLSVSFLNAETGIAVGDFGKILITRNGGLNWDSSQISTTTSFLSVCIIDSNIVIISGYDRKIFKSTNFGNNWYRIFSVNNGFNLNEIKFPDKTTGYIASSSGVILKSTNTGESWLALQHPDPFAYSFYGLDFVNGNTGYVVGYYGGSVPRSPILKTTNGGLNWMRQESSTTLPLYSVEFINMDTGIICGAGRIRTTTNGGINWLIPNGSFGSLAQLSYVNSQTIYAGGGNGTIIKSTDGGINWFPQISNTTSHLSGVCFVDELTGYAVGGNGTILKTTTGGIVGINTINNTIPEFFYLHQNYPNPFNPATNIKFDIPNHKSNDRRSDLVVLKVFDINGKEVSTLVNERLSAGSYEVEFNATNFPSGIYFYNLIEEGNIVNTKLMVLLK